MTCPAPKCNQTKSGKCTTPNAWALYLRKFGGSGLTKIQLKDGYKHWKYNMVKLPDNATKSEKNGILCSYIHNLAIPFPEPIARKKKVNMEKVNRIKNLDANRSERRKAARILAAMSPSDKKVEIARRNRVKRKEIRKKARVNQKLTMVLNIEETKKEKNRKDLLKRISDRLVLIDSEQVKKRLSLALKKARRVEKEAIIVKKKADRRHAKQVLKLKKQESKIKRKAKRAKKKATELGKIIGLIKKKKEAEALRTALSNIVKSVQLEKETVQKDKEILQQQRAQDAILKTTVVDIRKELRKKIVGPGQGDSDSVKKAKLDKLRKNKAQDIERATRIVENSNANIQLTSGTDCSITPKSMDDHHFSNFPKSPFASRENNCVYLARMFELSENLIPVGYISRGSQNVVYRAIGLGEDKGAHLVVRVGKIGDSGTDVGIYDFKYSSMIHKEAHSRLTTCNLSTPLVRHSHSPLIISKGVSVRAAVQVLDFVGGKSLCYHFQAGDGGMRQSLCRKFGRTLGVMHACSHMAHGDANGGNFMIDDKNPNSSTLVVVDLDRTVDLKGGMERSDVIISKNYDLTQAFSTIFHLVNGVALRYFPNKGKEYDLYVETRKTTMFTEFTKSYLETSMLEKSKKAVSSPKPVNFSRIWDHIPHVNEDSLKERKDVVSSEFLKYEKVWRKQFSKL